MINVHARSGDILQAEHWFQKMLEAKIQPDVVTYNALISSCARARDPDGAEAWLQRIFDSPVDPDVISYCMTIDACARSGDAHRAEKWLLRMEKDGMHATLTCYETLIKSFAKL